MKKLSKLAGLFLILASFMPEARAQLSEAAQAQVDAMPFYFMMPKSSYRDLSQVDGIDMSKIISYTHASTKNVENPLGLRLVRLEPGDQGIPKMLFDSKIIQSGDIVLTLRPEWGRTGSYPDIQLGVSHTGVAWANLEKGTIQNADNPLNEEYMVSEKSFDLPSLHYKSKNSSMFHVFRHRQIVENSKQQKNIRLWASMLVKNAPKSYLNVLSFNGNYMKSNFQSDPELKFVKHLAQMAFLDKGIIPDAQLSEYCSEFAWTLLALRNCDPEDEQVIAALKDRNAKLSCISKTFEPLPFIGSAASNVNGAPGLSDGPLLILKSQNVTDSTLAISMVNQIFPPENNFSNMSSGHQQVAFTMAKSFDPLKSLYLSVLGGADISAARQDANSKIPVNYSPTSFIIESLVAPNSPFRTMDYVVTLIYDQRY